MVRKQKKYEPVENKDVKMKNGTKEPVRIEGLPCSWEETKQQVDIERRITPQMAFLAVRTKLITNAMDAVRNGVDPRLRVLKGALKEASDEQRKKVEKILGIIS